YGSGCVLYETSGGRPRYEQKPTADMVVSILDRQPAPVSRYAPNAPEELEWIISRALAKDRDKRYQVIKTMLTDLKRLRKRMLFDAGQEETAELSLDEVVSVQERRLSSKDS